MSVSNILYQLLFTSQFDFFSVNNDYESPVSVCGVYVGLFFREVRFATTAEKTSKRNISCIDDVPFTVNVLSVSHECSFHHFGYFPFLEFVYSRCKSPAKYFWVSGATKMGKQYRLSSYHIIPGFVKTF